VAWDDPTVRWETFGLVVIRSTWDSVDRPTDYLAWATAVSARTRLANPAEVVSWNLDKRYLDDLSAAGIAVVATTWIEPADDTWAPPPGGPFVVKPAISGGGRETARYDDDDVGDADEHIDRLRAAGRTVMVQPYLPTIDVTGETKMVFVDGRFSHALRVGRLLEPAVGVRERPWEKPVPTTVATPTHDQLELAGTVVGHVDQRFGGLPLSARVDLVDAEPGRPVVLELELVDPSLSLWAASPAAPALAAAISDRLPAR
jgi:hypothetical protein